jgi:hypothetical protein
MRTVDRHVAAKSGLRSLPVKHAVAKLALAGVPAHINPREDRLLRRLLPESHGRVLTSGRLAKAGRLGDDRLTLVNPREAKLLKRRGGSGARNPATGLREFEDDKGDGNPGGGHNADGPASTGGYGPSGVGATSSPGSGPSGLGGGYGPGGFFSENEDLSVESEIGGPGVGKRGVGFDPENNPEMGGSRARRAGLASAEALGRRGEPQTNIHAASAIMAGLNPSMMDRFNDFTGYKAPGGFLQSRAANMGATIAGGLIGGPWGATAANIAHNVGVRGMDVSRAAPGAIGGAVAGGLGSLAAQAAADAITGYKSYDDTMSLADLDDKATSGVGRNGTTPGAPGDPGSGPDRGAGAGTEYVKALPNTEASFAVAAAPSADKPKDSWDEAGFLGRHPEVAKAVDNGTWTSGRAFNVAYKAETGASYDAVKAIGLVSPYTNDMLAAAPGEAVPYRG